MRFAALLVSRRQFYAHERTVAPRQLNPFGSSILPRLVESFLYKSQRVQLIPRSTKDNSSRFANQSERWVIGCQARLRTSLHRKGMLREFRLNSFAPLTINLGNSDSSAEVNIDIQGDCSGISGSHNKISSDNTTTTTTTINYFGGANSSEKHAEILQCLYTSRYESHRGRVREPAEGTCKWV